MNRSPARMRSLWICIATLIAAWVLVAVIETTGPILGILVGLFVGGVVIAPLTTAAILDVVRADDWRRTAHYTFFLRTQVHDICGPACRWLVAWGRERAQATNPIKPWSTEELRRRQQEEMGRSDHD